jgi:ketol-acid reductoisomerase
MVEVAFELLCGEGKDPEEAEEEFVDQCRVFAESFSESRY